MVVIDIRGRKEAPPVVRVAHPLLVGADASNVAMSYGVRMFALLLGGILSGHPKRIVAHRIEYIAAHQPVEAGHGVANRVVAHVSHVHATGGIGEHLETVELRLRVVDLNLEGARFGPRLLPTSLYFLSIVCHFFTPNGLRRESLDSLQKQ